MKFPNKYLRNLKPYKLASHKIWAVAPGQRAEVLKLDWNESTIPPSPKVAEYLNKIFSEPSFFNLYPTTYNCSFQHNHHTLFLTECLPKILYLDRYFYLEHGPSCI